MSITHSRLLSLSLLLVPACTDLDAVPELAVVDATVATSATSTSELDHQQLESSAAFTRVVADPPGRGVHPELRRLLDSGAPEELLAIDVRVDVPPFRAPELPPTSATISVEDGRPTYTLDDRRVDEAAMVAHATSVRRALDENLSRQFDERRRLVAAAIADAGLADVVRDRGDTWFRVELPRARAQTALRALEGRLRWARLAQDDAAVVGLRNHLHESNANDDPLDDGEDGALEHMGIIDYAHGAGHRGQGIGIWHNEGFAPWQDRPEFADADLRVEWSAPWQPVVNGGVCRNDDECCSGSCTGFLIGHCDGSGCVNCPMNPDGTCNSDIRTQEHATLVALAAHATAPDATIYHTATDLADCMISSSIDLETSPPVYVGAQSWHYVTDPATNNDYNELGDCNGEFDDYIRSSRIAHFHCAGNENNDYVVSPGRTFNVISVGNYDHVGDAITAESSHKNPSTGIEKPEILAPGTNITAAVLPGDDWTRTGTSIAAPIAAGMVADMMSGSAFFRNQPQAVKAYLIAGAHNAHGFPGFGISRSERDGAGRLDYLDTFYYRWGKTYNGSNSSFFNAQQKIVETHTLVAGKRYTIAIAWLASGDWAHDVSDGTASGPPLDQRMRLVVSRGATTYMGAIASNNFQLVDFTVPPGEGGTWTITIERTYNAGVSGVDLALTVGEHGA